MTGQEVKRKLRERGITIKQWSDENGYPYLLVSRVIRGVQKAHYGKGHEVAVALGMKKPSDQTEAA